MWLLSIVSYWIQSTPNDQPITVGRNQYRPLPNIFVIKHISWALGKKLPSKESLFAHLSEGRFSTTMLKSLKGLLSVSTLYKDLLNASIDLRVAETRLFKHGWIPQEQQSHRHRLFNGYTLNREEILACIAIFESGSFNLHPSAMDRVLAIASGNSIYVARCLLQDPCGPQSSTAIERIVVI